MTRLYTALMLGTALVLASSPAQSADLGGNCCADLEERIAELEATTAKKGNKKVSLRVYGQVNAALTYVEAGEFDDTRVIQNGADESFVGFAGSATINPGLSAGYVLELDARQFGVLGQQESLEVNVRQSFWYIKSDALGSLSLGKTGNATNNFDKINTANTAVAIRPLSLQPLSDSQLAGIDLPFDGTYTNVVRYDSASLAGFFLSASWGASGPDDSFDTGDVWDVALRYAGEAGGFMLAGGVGYRVDSGQEIDIHLAGLNLALPTFSETKTLLATGSVMHATSGLFVTANFADQEWSGGIGDGLDLQMWQAQAGIETRLSSLGKTTFFGMYGQLDIDGVDAKPELYGAGIVQAIDAAAMDLYVTYTQYDLDMGDDDTIDVIAGGARIRF